MKKEIKKEIKKKFGVLSSSLKTIVYKIARKPLPIEYLVFEVTDFCNSRCQQCNIWQKKGHAPMTFLEIEKIFKSGFLKNVKELIVTGGEPVLRQDILELMLLMQKYISPNAYVTLSTNGLKPERVLRVSDACLKNNMNLVVGVSIDGIGEHHDRIRGVPGNFEKVDFLLRELLKLKKNYGDKLQVSACYTLSKNAVPYFQEVQEYVEKLGLSFLPQVFEAFSYYDNTQLNKVSLNDDIKKAINLCQEGFQKEVIISCLNGKFLNYRCGSLSNFFLLRSNGDIAPCFKFSEMSIGNLKNHEFVDLFWNKNSSEARKAVSSCRGCSNTWATGWSKRYWCFPFLGMFSKATVKKALALKK